MMSHQGARSFALREVMLLVLIVAMGLMVGTDAGKFEIEVSSLKVVSPSSLVGEFDASIGDFGVPLYGAQLTGSLLWVPDHPGACSAFPLPLHKVAPDNGQEGLPIIALVERGHGCYFVEKVWYAQEAGAQAVLIMDNRDEDLLTMAVPADAVASSDFSHRLDIPAALVKQEVGQRLKAALTGGEQVVVQLDWTESMLHPDDRVEWEFWHSSSPACGRACETAHDFIAGFQETAEQLDKDGDTKFQPHFMFQKCSSTRRLSGECSREKCIRGGRYCPVEAVGSEYRDGLEPRQVMVENLRQLCIWRYWNDQDQGWLWWEYAARFGKSCRPSTRPSSATSSTGFTDTCAESVMHDLGIPVHTVNECMGAVDQDEDHDLLEAELSLMADDEGSGRGLVMLMPTVVINTNQYRGRLDSLSILKAICSGFAEGTEPQVCLSTSIQKEDCLSAASDQCWRGDGKSACIDTFRGFVCLCPSGYSGNGQQCELVDQCSVNNGGCEERCVSGRGGAPICSCGPGLQLAADGKHCEDVHECSQPTPPCAQVCTEKDPRLSNGGAAYECSCRPGYAINPANASDCITQQALRTALVGEDRGGSSSSSIGQFVALVVLCTVTVVAVVYGLYRWKIRGTMSKEMRMIMKEYIPVEGAASGLGERLMEPASSPAQYTANTHAPTTSSDLV